MKRLAIVLMMAATPVMASESLSGKEVKEVEALLAEAASKLLYVSRDCDKPIDPSKFKDIAKLKAFSEGYYTLDGISWDNVKYEAHRQYGELKVKAPIGELCEDYKAQLKGKYKWLKDTNAATK
jgi:hypothetical protein